MPPLKLVALDAEDLGIISAQLQDAVMRLEDVAYLPTERRFVMVLNRFDWPTAFADADPKRPANERRRSGVRFENVRAVRRHDIPQQSPDTVLSLLAITFAPALPPAGSITLIFAGGGAIRLDVDCIEAELSDLGAAWSANTRPDHTTDDPDARATEGTPAAAARTSTSR